MVEEKSQGDLVLRFDEDGLSSFGEALENLGMSESGKMLSYVGIESDESSIYELEGGDLGTMYRKERKRSARALGETVPSLPLLLDEARRPNIPKSPSWSYYGFGSRYHRRWGSRSGPFQS